MRIIDFAPIPGDPSGMRAAASAIERQVADLDRLRTRVTRSAATMEFKSKLGNRTKSEVATMGSQAAAQCAILSGLAGQIRQRATAVETAQRDRAATIERIRAEDAERLRQAQAGA